MTLEDGSRVTEMDVVKSTFVPNFEGILGKPFSVSVLWLSHVAGVAA